MNQNAFRTVSYTHLLDEIRKDFVQKFVAFAYEDICRSIFADLCREGVIDFVPSRIGAYWLNDLDSDTEIDVMAVDHQNKRFFAGAVSYTHLDVYKRQGQLIALKRNILPFGDPPIQGSPNDQLLHIHHVGLTAKADDRAGPATAICFPLQTADCSI